MKPDQQQRNPQHQPETTSTASVQVFDDPEGGLPLDSDIVQERLKQQRGRPVNPSQSNSQQTNNSDNS